MILYTQSYYYLVLYLVKYIWFNICIKEFFRNKSKDWTNKNQDKVRESNKKQREKIDKQSKKEYGKL